jgi:aryl-alcohol dehydrogenase-like predicted oxidoreductase
MEYTTLGNTDLKVSRLGMGGIPFGSSMDAEEGRRVLDEFLDNGGNFVDTSNIYGGGMRGTHEAGVGGSETAIGKMIKGRRDRVVLATKGYWSMVEDARLPDQIGLGRNYLTKNLDASLKRLGTDYVDLYQCHAWDFDTPLEETIGVLDEFVQAGKVRHAGVSNWDGWHVVKGVGVAGALDVAPIVTDQIWYNIVDRVAERSLIPACRDQNVSIIAWGALAQGFLSGVYRRGCEGPGEEGSFAIMEDVESSSWNLLAVERNWATLDVIDGVAKAHGRTIANVAMRWLLQCGNCDVALVGGTCPEHYRDTVKIMDFELSAEDMDALNTVSTPPFCYPTNFLDLFCRKESEFYGGLREFSKP